MDIVYLKLWSKDPLIRGLSYSISCWTAVTIVGLLKLKFFFIKNYGWKCYNFIRIFKLLTIWGTFGGILWALYRRNTRPLGQSEQFFLSFIFWFFKLVFFGKECFWAKKRQTICVKKRVLHFLDAAIFTYRY
jgi:hypothetical protein